MSIEQDARQLIESAGEVVNNAIGANGASVAALDQVSQGVAQVQQICEDSTSLAANLLGEGHAATASITGSAALVAEKVQGIHGLVEQLRGELINLDATVIAHGDAIRTAGERAMGS